MKQVLLSHDSKVRLYAVPDEVADHLEEYCLDFAVNWIWKDPEGRKLLRKIGGVEVAVYGAPEFIDYLNRRKFPHQPSVPLDWYDYELPEEYAGYPQFHF